MVMMVAAVAVFGADDRRELPTAGWLSRTFELDEVETPVAPDGGVVPLPVVIPGDNEFVRRVTKGWHGFDRLDVELTLPEGLPVGARLYLFIKDWDDLWFQCLAATVESVPEDGGRRLTLSAPISGEAATLAWKGQRHTRPWHQLTPGQVAECGVKISYPSRQQVAFRGTLRLHGARLVADADSGEVQHRVEALRFAPVEPTVGSMVEAAFRLTHPFRDPFLRDAVDIVAEVIQPDGRTVTVRAFYYEGFLLDPTTVDGELIPAGRPEFRVRFTPVMAGEHRMRLRGTVEGAELTFPDHTFRAAPGAQPFRGFLRPCEADRRFLEFSLDGSEFWGTGLNVRSPFDTRYMESFGFSQWPRQDLGMYRELFPKFRRSGIRVVEVWMSPWWLGLEWIPDAPGNHGIGYMNPWRAWKMDRVVEWAEQNGIYLIILLNNHGKFSAWCDSDWGRNPFNRANGGYLDAPQQYFTHPRAMADFRRFADYLVARWAHSPNILAWKLFSEIDLTGQNREWYKSPLVARWHAKMGAYMKKIDPNQHMVTTHWADNYKIVNRNLAGLPELDMLTLDAYYHQGGAQRLFELVLGTATFGREMDKPCVITEFGGTPWGDTSAHLHHQLHLALWQGFFNGLAVSPCFWWFPMVEERDLYQEYRAVDRFGAGETRRGALASHRWREDGVVVCELRKADRLLLWLFDGTHYFGGEMNAAPMERRAEEMPVSGLSAGRYVAEFWDCAEGVVHARQPLVIERDGAAGVLRLPAYTRDLAVKVKREE